MMPGARMPFAASTAAIASRRQELDFADAFGCRRPRTGYAAWLGGIVPSATPPCFLAPIPQRGLHLLRGPAVRRGALLFPNVADVPRKIPARPDFSSLERSSASPTPQTACANLAAPPTAFPIRVFFLNRGF